MIVMRAAQAGGEHWGHAAKTCLAALQPLPDGANVGLLYVTEGFADDLSSILTFLRETTHIADWIGGAGLGVFGPEGEVYEGRSMAVMAAHLPAQAIRPFNRFEPDERDDFLAEHGEWLARQSAITALVHGDPREAEIGEMVGRLADVTQAFLVGGLTAASEIPVQVSGRVHGAGLSGLLLGDDVPLATGLSQGCTPIGRSHQATEVSGNIIMALDGRPALEVLKMEAGDIIARDLQRAAGYIHVAVPVGGSDTGDYAVRGLLAIDPRRGWLAVGGQLAKDERVMFVRRDANAAQKDFKRMLKSLAKRVEGQTIRGGVYISCVARGSHMFGEEGRETKLIHDILGAFPLVGFSANGEISNNRLYGFTGVLALFL